MNRCGNSNSSRYSTSHKVQAERMRRDAAGATNTAFQHFPGPLHRTLAGTDGHQYPGDIAHHMVQEGAGTDIQDNHLAVAGHPQVMNLFDRRLGLALASTKRAEIVDAHQMLGRLSHSIGVQRAVVPGDFFVEVRRADLIVVDHIAITPGDGLEARMKVRRHHLGPTDADVVGQVDIGAHDPRLHRALGLGVKVHHLPASVYTGVGTPGTHQRDRRVGDFRQGLLQGFLHRRHAGGLALPATIARAFVFHAQGDSEKACGRHFGGRVIYICQELRA